MLSWTGNTELTNREVVRYMCSQHHGIASVGYWCSKSLVPITDVGQMNKSSKHCLPHSMPTHQSQYGFPGRGHGGQTVAWSHDCHMMVLLQVGKLHPLADFCRIISRSASDFYLCSYSHCINVSMLGATALIILLRENSSRQMERHTH